MKIFPVYLFLILGILLAHCTSKTYHYAGGNNPIEEINNYPSVFWEGNWVKFSKDSMEMAIYKPNPGKYNQEVILNSHYPAQARENGIEGNVSAEVIINELGALEATKIVKGIGHGCDENFLNAIRTTARRGFEPARYKRHSCEM